MNKKKVFLLSAILIGMVAGASATLGTPSKVEVNACNNFFDDCDGTEKVIVFEWTDNQFDSSRVSVTADEISSRIETGEVKDSFTMQITGSQSQAKYDIRDGGNEDLYTVDAISNEWKWCRYFPCSDYEDAPSQSEREQIYENWAGNNGDDLDGDGFNPWAVEENTPTLANDVLQARAYALAQGSKYANVGDISTDPREEMATTFEVGGIEKTLSNSDIGRGQTANFGGQAKINFRGGLESGYNFPIMDDSLVVYNEQRFNGFRVVEKDAVQSEYPTFLDNIESLSTVEDWRDEDGTDEETIERQSKNKLSEVTQQYSQSELFDQDYEIQGNDISSGEITVKGDEQYSYPSFQVYVKGDAIEYVVPEAEPEIVDSQGAEIKEGEPKDISVTVGNKDSATGDGDFSVSVKDTSTGFNWNGISKSVDLSPGETERVDLSISYGEDSQQKENSGTATVEVKNLRDTSEKVTREVPLTGIQSNNCEPGEYSVIYNEDESKTIQKCGSDGQTKEDVATCGAEERVKTLNDGTKTCVKDDDDVEDQPKEDDPDNPTNPDTKKLWIPSDGGDRCISQVVSEGTTIEPSYSSQSECESSLQGNVGCAIQIPSLNPASYVNPVEEPEPTGVICGENKVYANVLLTLIIGLIGVQAGRKIGGAVDPDDENKPQTATLVLASGLGVLGGVVGFLFISVAQAVGFILGAGLIYLIYKGIMYYTGAEALKDVITG